MSTNSPYIDYICIIIVDVATLPFAADSERPQSAVRDVLVQTWYQDITRFRSWSNVGELKKKKNSATLTPPHVLHLVVLDDVIHPPLEAETKVLFISL